MDDCQIVQLFILRSEDAIIKVKSKYGKFCFRLAFNILRNRQDAEECENETYLRAWNAIPPKKPDALMPYLGKIVRRLALQRYEYNSAKKRNVNLELSFDELEECIAEASNVEKQYTDCELGKTISNFLYNVDKESRVIFVRRYWYMDSIRKISILIGASESKIKSSLFRTRNKLRLYLEKEGFFYDGKKIV